MRQDLARATFGDVSVQQRVVVIVSELLQMEQLMKKIQHETLNHEEMMQLVEFHLDLISSLCEKLRQINA